jgi:serine/threonine protein phosphatase PrpC
MSFEIASLSYSTAAAASTTTTQPPNEYHLYVRRPERECATSLLERSLTESDVFTAPKRIRLTTDEKNMVGVQITAAEDHECSPSMLPVHTPTRGGIPHRLTTSVCSLKGRRLANEDAHVVTETKYGCIFAVCDGHGIIDKQKLAEDKPQIGQEVAEKVAHSVETDLPQFIERNTFNMKRTFEEWCEHIHSNIPSVIAGATVAIGFYEKISQLLHVATVGDTEIVVFRMRNGLIYPIPMSPSMDWNHPAAIERVRGILPPSEFEKWIQIMPVKERRFPERGVNTPWSIGDKLMTKDGQTAISHTPMCSLLQLQDGDIILTGCDGIFDFTNVDDLIDNVLEKYWNDPHTDLATIIAHYALNVKKSSDNVSAMVTRVGGLIEDDLPSTQPIHDDFF